MTINKLKPGMIVYSVGKRKMGNTKMSTTAYWPVKIIAVDIENLKVEASWNYNQSRIYSKHEWSKWRLNRPII